MPLFKKRSPNTIDLTKLQKRGILQRSEKIARSQSSTSEEAIDLTPQTKKESLNSTLQSENSLNPFELLQNLANTPQTPKESFFQQQPPLDLSHIKIKIEDLEYKIDKFLERLQKIEEKLERI